MRGMDLLVDGGHLRDEEIDEDDRGDEAVEPHEEGDESAHRVEGVRRGVGAD